MSSPVVENRGRSSKLPTIPKAAVIAALVLAGFNILFAATGHILSIVFALIPLVAGIGILRRKAWSAYGFALFETTQLLLTPLLLLRSGTIATAPKTTILLSVALTVGLIVLFVFAGRALSTFEEPRSTTDSRSAPKSAAVPLSSGGGGSRPVLASEEHAHNGPRPRHGTARIPFLYGAVARGLCASGSQKGHAALWIGASVLVTAPFLFLQAFAVPTGAMEDTLMMGDKILVRVFPKTNPVDGDIIAFVYPVDRRQIYIKRVIGIPGDRISISKRTVYRNGKAIPEPYAVHRFAPTNLYGENFPAKPDARAPIQAPAQQMLKQNVVNGELVVPPGKYFVLGDNRENSFDSRYWGFVDPADVIGKPIVIYDSEQPSIARQQGNSSLGWSRIRWHRLFKLL